jgi:hypothetical protein
VNGYSVTRIRLLVTVILMEPNADTFNVYEAAKALNCTSQWIRVLLAEQRLTGAHKVDGVWRIPASALDVVRQRQQVSA